MGLDDLCSVSWIQCDNTTGYRTYYVLYTVQLSTVRNNGQPVHVMATVIPTKAAREELVRSFHLEHCDLYFG